MGPDALDKFLFVLRKKSVTSSLRRVRPVVFRFTKFKLQRRRRPAQD